MKDKRQANVTTKQNGDSNREKEKGRGGERKHWSQGTRKEFDFKTSHSFPSLQTQNLLSTLSRFHFLSLFMIMEEEQQQTVGIFLLKIRGQRKERNQRKSQEWADSAKKKLVSLPNLPSPKTSFNSFSLSHFSLWEKWVVRAEINIGTGKCDVNEEHTVDCAVAAYQNGVRNGVLCKRTQLSHEIPRTDKGNTLVLAIG